MMLSVCDDAYFFRQMLLQKHAPYHAKKMIGFSWYPHDIPLNQLVDKADVPHINLYHQIQLSQIWQVLANQISVMKTFWLKCE